MWWSMGQTELLGEIIRSERKSRKLTQQQLGELTGTGLNFISQLERGKQTVRLDKLLEVLQALGIELHLRRGRKIISAARELKR